MIPFKGNSYPGRGIIVGKTPDGRHAVTGYFIMGRSANSRNRILRMTDGVLYTKAFDESKVQDPSLIIYPALRLYENTLIVTNGDHTNTVYEGLKNGKTFSQALKSRNFEPDAPNYTPRISALLSFDDGDFSYRMSILKSSDANGTTCNRFTYSYESVSGKGHVIHTYKCNGNPIPPFEGEPCCFEMSDDMDEFAQQVWNALDDDNRISLYVRYTDLCDLTYRDVIINKNN